MPMARNVPATDLVVADARVLGGSDERVDVGIGGDPDSRVITAVHSSTGPSQLAAGVSVVDGSGWRIGPGLIDLQVNGGWGLDLTNDPSHIWDIGTRLAEIGVTAWVPTLVSSPLEVRRKAIAVLATGPPAGWVGAEPLGWHFEGPYLNPDRRGAHPLSAIQPVPPAILDEPLPRIMTLAPELNGALDAIAALAAKGVVVSVGHTEATSSGVADAMTAGASMGTHLFNAMTGLTHRQPGAAVGLLESNAWLGLIADGHHVAPEMLCIVWRLAADRIVLVSDAMAGLGLDAGPTMLGSQPATIAGGTVRLADGTMAGSVLSLPDAVARFAAMVDVSFPVASALASRNPAGALRLDDRGRVAAGQRADLTVYDEDNNVVAAFLAGAAADNSLVMSTA